MLDVICIFLGGNMETYREFRTSVLVAALLVVLSACGGGGGGNGDDTQQIAENNIPPTITIASPSSNPTYTTSNSSVTISGTASDDVGVTEITWVNSEGGTGERSNGACRQLRADSREAKSGREG